MKDMEDNVFYPILSPLSEKDLFYLRSVAEFGDIIKVSDLLKHLGKDANSFQVYRKRLIDAGILNSVFRSCLNTLGEKQNRQLLTKKGGSEEPPEH